MLSLQYALTILSTVGSSAETDANSWMDLESITSKVGRQLLIAYASIRPRNSALVAASMAPMLDKPSQIAKASRPASSNVATTSSRRTPRARNRAAHCSLDESSSDQLSDSQVTVLQRNCADWKNSVGGKRV